MATDSHPATENGSMANNPIVPMPMGLAISVATSSPVSGSATSKMVEAGAKFSGLKFKNAMRHIIRAQPDTNVVIAVPKLADKLAPRCAINATTRMSARPRIMVQMVTGDPATSYKIPLS